MNKKIRKKTDIKKRKAFNFLRSYYDVLEEINDDKDKLDYLLAILKKQFEGIETELHGISKLCYIGQKHSIDTSRKGWEDYEGWVDPTLTIGGSEGGIEGGIEHPTLTIPPYIQEKEEEKEEEKEQEKEEEKEEVKEKEINKKVYYEKNKATIHFLMENYQLDTDAAIELQIQNEEVEKVMSRIFN